MAYSMRSIYPTYFAGTYKEAKDFIKRNIDDCVRGVILDEFHNPNVGFNKYDKGFPDAATLQNQIPKNKIIFH